MHCDNIAYNYVFKHLFYKKIYEVMEHITGDIHDLNVGFYKQLPIIMDLDSIYPYNSGRYVLLKEGYRLCLK